MFCIFCNAISCAFSLTFYIANVMILLMANCYYFPVDCQEEYARELGDRYVSGY